MPLNALAGNDALKEQLRLQLRQGRLGHAFIVSGPAGSGRELLGDILARAMVCSSPEGKPCGSCPDCKKALSGIHPDIITVVPEEDRKTISVEQIRRLGADAHIRPNEAMRKVYLLPETDHRLRGEGQNAMLKLLEEGPSYAAFVLLAENAGSLLTTVRSRCQELTLTLPHGAQDPQPDPQLDEVADRMVRCWQERDEQALMQLCVSIEKGTWDRARFFALLDRLPRRFTAQITGGGDRKQALRGISMVEQLRRTRPHNMSVGHMTGWLCAALMTG